MDFTDSIQEYRKQLRFDHSNYSTFNFMQDCSKLLRQQLQYIWENTFNNTNRGIALFTYGSVARSEFMDNSDVDVLIVSDEVSIPDRQIALFIRHCENLQYDKVDVKISKRQNLEDVSANIIIADCTFSATYLCGDESLCTMPYKTLFNQPDLDWQLARLCFSAYYLDDYFSLLRSSSNNPNLKYARGAIRDSIFVNWLYQYLGTESLDVSFPHIYQVLNNFESQHLFSKEEIIEIRQAIDFLALLKNEGLHLNRGTSHQGRTSLNASMLNRLLEYLTNYLNTLNIKNTQELLNFFHVQCSIVANAKQKCLAHAFESGYSEKNALRNVLLEKLQAGEAINYLDWFRNGDISLKISIIWLANRYGRDQIIANLCDECIHSSNWTVLASLCCSKYATSTFLDAITNNQLHTQQDDYIARFIAVNSNSPRETLKGLLNMQMLPSRYRKLLNFKLNQNRTLSLGEAGKIIYSPVPT